MAQSTLPVFSHPFLDYVFNQTIGREIARVDQILTRAELVTCCADACHERATVAEIESGVEYCEFHFQEVERG